MEGVEGRGVIVLEVNMLEKVVSGMGCPDWYTPQPYTCKDYCRSTALTGTHHNHTHVKTTVDLLP